MGVLCECTTTDKRDTGESILSKHTPNLFNAEVITILPYQGHFSCDVLFIIFADNWPNINHMQQTVQQENLMRAVISNRLKHQR